MKIVQQAAIRPNRCAVIPYIGNTNAAGFIDTGMDLDLEHVYVSFEAVCEMAKMLGWSGPSVVRGLEAQLAALGAEFDQVKAELTEANRQLDAIDYLSSAGQLKAYKKAGRPSKEKV